MGFGREKTPQLARPRITPPFLRTMEPTVWAILECVRDEALEGVGAGLDVFLGSLVGRTLSPREGCPDGPVVRH